MSTPSIIRLTLDVSETTFDNLCKVVEYCNDADKSVQGHTSHGQLTVARLLEMLAEDAAMTQSRPGSWEGANMQTVLDSHGYH
jgi:hypothetical protein